MFRQMDLKGQTQADTQLKTTHQNTINTIRVYEESGGNVRKFTSRLAALFENVTNGAQRVVLMAGWLFGRSRNIQLRLD